MEDLNIQQSNNPSPNKWERQAQKKAAHAAEVRKNRRIMGSKKVFYWVLGILVVFGGGWWLVGTSGPQGQDFSAAVEVLGREHIADGSVYPSYNSNPPTSGPHYANPAIVRFYDQELADEQVVHNLEHGHIWIAYKPDLPAESIEILRKLAGGNVIVTPRARNDTDIALVAWGRLDAFDVQDGVLDVERIEDFILRYRNRGPENLTRLGHLN